MIIKGKEYKINRENIKVSEWDEVYYNLLSKIVNEGIKTENRTGVDTYSIPNYFFELNTGKEFPILESKKVFVKNLVSEIQWIHQVQSNRVDWLHDRNNKIWDQWVIDKDGIYRIYAPNVKKEDVDSEKRVQVKDINGKTINGLTASSLVDGKMIKDAIYYGEDLAGTIGKAYGYTNSITKQPQLLEKKLKENPTDRRMIINLHQAQFLKEGVLEPCVWSSEWRVLGGKLYLNVHQRSADTPVGLPFNITEYAVMQAMMAKANNLEIGTMGWSITDAHIYVDQLEGVKKQLQRIDQMKKVANYIQSHTDEEVDKKYHELLEKKELLNKLKENDKALVELSLLEETIEIFEFMITKEKPVLEVKEHQSFFDYSTNYNLDKDYLKTNPTGNDDIKLLKYKSLSKIDFPVAQ